MILKKGSKHDDLYDFASSNVRSWLSHLVWVHFCGEEPKGHPWQSCNTNLTRKRDCDMIEAQSVTMHERSIKL